MCFQGDGFFSKLVSFGNWWGLSDRLGVTKNPLGLFDLGAGVGQKDPTR